MTKELYTVSHQVSFGGVQRDELLRDTGYKVHVGPLGCFPNATCGTFR